MGKYAAILPKLEHLPPQDPGYQAKVDRLKAALTEAGYTSAPKLANKYRLLRSEKEHFKSELYTTEMYLAACEQLLVASNQADDPDWGQYGATSNMLRLANGDKIEVRAEPYAAIEDRDKVREWAIKEGLERLLALPWQTLNDQMKQRLLKGESEPDGVKAFYINKIVFTRNKTDGE